MGSESPRAHGRHGPPREIEGVIRRGPECRRTKHSGPPRRGHSPVPSLVQPWGAHGLPLGTSVPGTGAGRPATDEVPALPELDKEEGKTKHTGKQYAVRQQ